MTDAAVKKIHIDEEVADILGKKPREVSVITTAFFDEVVRALADKGSVHIPQLGTLKVVARHGVVTPRTQLTSFDGKKRVVRVPLKYYVTLSKSAKLRSALNRWCTPPRKETVMEKYGVDESADERLEKQASDGCPKCGKKPLVHGRVLMCPTHGSEPFETKK